MLSRLPLVFVALMIAAAPACAGAPQHGANLEGLYPENPATTAEDILAQAYEKAGGETWLRPKTLLMTGYGVFYRSGAVAEYDDYRMWRVYPKDKGDAHRADGKVRLEGKVKGETVFLLTFDGERTYDINGPVADQSANAQWAANFGFGAIRYGLDASWSRRRLPDDLVDGELAFFVELTDPSGGVTRFGIAQDDYRILSVGFDTPRGFHERRYSEFYSKPGVSWLQPGRVRLFYDGVKQNEIIWTDFVVNGPMDDAFFVIEAEQAR